MTADAKVGLLLGLIFIVVIAFLINGLPRFLQAASAEEQFDTQIEIPTAPDLVIDNRVVQTARQLDNEIPLRQTTPPDQVVILDDPSGNGFQALITPEQIAPVSVQVPNVPAEPQPHIIQPVTVQTHVVQSGENLPVVAKKYYGSEEGNRRIVVQKLFEANRDVLESPDKICVGDTLSIPPLDVLLNGPARVSAAPAAQERPSLLSRFSNLFERADTDDRAKVYVVQEGESLWSIAEKTLGEGKRYREIIALNNISDPDNVPAGKKLKIPE